MSPGVTGGYPGCTRCMFLLGKGGSRRWVSLSRATLTVATAAQNPLVSGARSPADAFETLGRLALTPRGLLG